MSKLERFTGDIPAFASEALSRERTVFGTELISDDINQQINSFFKRGWGMVGGSDQPSMQDFNALAFTLSQLIAYLYQRGVSEFNSDANYYEDSAVIYDGNLWLAKVDEPTDAPGISPGEWVHLLTLEDASDRSDPNKIVKRNAEGTFEVSEPTQIKHPVRLTELNAHKNDTKAHHAVNITYSNDGSGLAAEDVQSAVDEVTNRLINVENTDTASHNALDGRELPEQHPISAITDLASELDSKVLKYDKDSFDDLSPYSVGIAFISSSSHSMILTDLVTELGLEVGDIIQISGSSYAANNRIRRVESIVNNSEVVLSRRFQFLNTIQAGNTALVNESGVLLSVKRLSKWYTTSTLSLGTIATQEAMESTKSLNGYLKAGGIIIQWGRVSNIQIGTDASFTTVKFPIAFPVQCCSVQVSPYLATKGNASGTYGVNTLTASSFNVKCRMNEDNYNNITYIAIGY